MKNRYGDEFFKQVRSEKPLSQACLRKRWENCKIACPAPHTIDDLQLFVLGAGLAILQRVVLFGHNEALPYVSYHSNSRLPFV
jgi:hypothetical protein